MDPVKPRELLTAARLADALVYAAGVAGVVAGGLLLRDGQVAFAVVAWTLTFVAGAGLRLAAWAGRALAELLVRVERIEEQQRDLRGPSRGMQPSDRGDTVPDPYGRWGHH